MAAMNDVTALQAEPESSGVDVDGLLARRIEIMELRRAAAAQVNAWATGGLSLLVDKALRRLTSSGNPCEAVQKAIEK